MRWAFAKYSGCGNDFILFDNRNRQFPHSDPLLFSRLCHRQLGIGADGIILLESSEIGDCRMRIFNPDGSEAHMCGNGLRCFVKWIKTLGYNQNDFRIETKQALLRASCVGRDVSVSMHGPTEVQWDCKIDFQGKVSSLHRLNTGVPHVVIFDDQIDKIDLKSWGPKLRHSHESNVNFVQLLADGKLKIRTFERGVEAETLACGTGATAAALAGAYQYGLKGPVTVETLSKEHLEIDFLFDGRQFSEVTMTGPAICTFTGEVELNPEKVVI